MAATTIAVKFPGMTKFDGRAELDQFERRRAFYPNLGAYQTTLSEWRAC